jgi:hypothetical protein
VVNDKPPDMLQTARGGIAVLMLVAMVVTRPITAFSTRPGTAGSRHFGGFVNGIGLILMPFVLAMIAAEAPPHERAALPIYGFWGLVVAANIYQRAKGAAMRRRGYSVHSGYVGRPLITLWPSKHERDTKWRWDTATAGLIGMGWGYAFDCPAVLFYAVGSAFLSVIPVVWMSLRDEARIRVAEDAEHDAAWLSSELERRRRNRWN